MKPKGKHVATVCITLHYTTGHDAFDSSLIVLCRSVHTSSSYLSFFLFSLFCSVRKNEKSKKQTRARFVQSFYVWVRPPCGAYRSLVFADNVTRFYRMFDKVSFQLEALYVVFDGGRSVRNIRGIEKRSQCPLRCWLKMSH